MGAVSAMLALHPYLVAFTFIFLFLYGCWAGIICPLGRSLRLRFFLEGYSHKSHIMTTVFSALVGLAVPLGLLGLSFRYHGVAEGWKPANYFDTVWQACEYWTNYEQFQQIPAVFWYIYGSQFLMTFLEIIFMFIVVWPPTPAPATEPAPLNHAWIVVCHNSSGILQQTVPALLKFVRPCQIYIADNGSSAEEQALTDELCQRLSNEYYANRPNQTDAVTQVQVTHIPIGSKTLAQYATVHYMLEQVKCAGSPIDTVTIIDDDVIPPPTWCYSSVDRKLSCEGTVALAYPLRAGNPDQSVCSTLQDVEYLGGNVHRFAQDVLGSQLWASGAIATWRLEILKNVLDRHCTVFNGEDLEMGYILHKLSGRQTDKFGVGVPLKIGWVSDCVVPTIVPPCTYHWYDFIPAGRKKKWNVKPCSCGEHSFFNQRLRSWDPASHQYLFKFIQIIFSRGGTWSVPKNFIRVLCTWKVLGILREYSLYITLIYSFARARGSDQWIAMGVFWADCLMIAWAHLSARSVLTSWNLRNIGMSFRPDIVLVYPILYGFPYEFIVRFVVLLYTYMYYLFAKPFPNTIRDQVVANPGLAETLHSAWRKKDDTIDVVTHVATEPPKDEVLLADDKESLVTGPVPFMPFITDDDLHDELSMGDRVVKHKRSQSLSTAALSPPKKVWRNLSLRYPRRPASSAYPAYNPTVDSVAELMVDSGSSSSGSTV
ncbi:hypothetical protein HDU85_003897 [Gaertneriomyces sp. JEL0708]|nr:hypothetical protein HDU85_003897 [Gaertneriomyces sp. JEL0708]